MQLFPGGINNRGVIVGEYIAPDRESGFVRDRRGRITRIDLPGAAGTQVDKINDRGQIVGNDSMVSAFLPGDGSRGYVLERGKVTRIDVPEARLTVPHGINDRGQVVGEYTDANGMDHGFLWTRGRVTTFAVADATFTKPNAINDRGEIVGIYGGTDGAIHGFHLRHGRTTTLDAPGATATIPYDVNDRGQIAVSAFTPTADDPFAGARGFVLRDGIEGPFTEVRFPGAPRTFATGIDDRGRIVGLYEKPNYQSSTATPRPQPDRMPPMGRTS